MKTKQSAHYSVLPKTTDRQLAFDLFYAVGSHQTIDKIEEDVGFRRNNIFLNISDLSLSARRFLDVAYFIVAQQEDKEGIHVANNEMQYDVDLHFFKWLMGYQSRNQENFKRLANEVQRGLISVLKGDQNEEKTQAWASVQLLGAVAVSNGIINFQVNKILAKNIKQPSHFHFLNLRYVFNSIHSRILFDFLQPYLNDKKTPWIKLDDFREALNCNSKSYQQYKLLNQHVIKVAVEEINKTTNITIKPKTKRAPKSRAMGYIQFEIEIKEQDNQALAMQKLKHLFYELRGDFGLNNAQIDQLTAYIDEENGVQRIIDAMEYTRYQTQVNGVKIKSPAAYLMTAVEKGLVVGALLKEQSNLGGDYSVIEPKQVPKAGALSDGGGEGVRSPLLGPEGAFHVTEENENLSEQGWSLFNDMDTTKKQTLLTAFSKELYVRTIATSEGLRTKDITSNIIINNSLRRAFGVYVKKKAESNDENFF